MSGVLKNNEDLAKSGRASRQKALPEQRCTGVNVHDAFSSHPVVSWGREASPERNVVYW